ncbi:MAG TPA: efflux RND transporter periplasmic adaptor subunit [Bryobacteraceae bacterium]|nr:efflux RND transporter periplasmic adaptor subunit [Bryobacteraceae bacterium]
MRLLAETGLLCALIAVSSCGRSQAPVVHAASTESKPATAVAAAPSHEVHLTGIVQAVHFFTVQVPQVMGQGGMVTLTHIIANGSRVKEGDLLAEFDRTQEVDNARDAKAKFDDLSHQVEQKQAQNRADAAKRASDLQAAEADLAKAELELRKGPLLSEIDRLKNEVKAEAARQHVASLKKSSGFHDQADAAAVRILELQRDRQKVSLDRALSNADKLQIHAKLDGMVSLENVWRNNSMGKAQEGDKLWAGQALIRLFDPTEMEVRAQVGEPDDIALTPGCRATVRLDAYPDMVFEAHMVAASPVAAAALGTPIKTFSARFRLDKSDPHLLPDLSAAVVLEAGK